MKRVVDALRWEPKPQVDRLTAIAWPFRNRVCRLVLVLIPVFLLGAIVYAWQLFSGMLFAEKAFITKCNSLEIAAYLSRCAVNSDDCFIAACHSQDQAIQVIYNLNMATELAMGAFAGAVLDAWGPLKCAILGHCVMLPALLLLAFASSSQSWMYTASATLLGAGTNLVVFPAVVFADLFPAHSGLIVSIVVAIQNLGVLVTSALELLYRRAGIEFGKLFIVYALVIVFPLQILSCLSTPMIRPSLDPQVKDYINPPCTPQAVPSPINSNGHHNNSGGSMAVSLLLCDSHVTSRSFVHNSRSFIRPSRSGISLGSEFLATRSCSGGLNGRPIPANVSGVLLRSVWPNNNNNGGGGGSPTGEPSPTRGMTTAVIMQQTPTVWQELLRLEMILYSIYSFFMILMYNYYSVVLRDVSGLAVSRLNGYAMPSVALWGILYGVLVDSLGTLFMSHVTTTIIMLVYVFILTNVVALHYAATLLHIAGSACVYTLKFTFMGEFFAPANQGKLLAWLSLVSGLGLLTNILCKMIRSEYQVLCVFLGFTPICTLLVGVLSFRQTKLAIAGDLE